MYDLLMMYHALQIVKLHYYKRIGFILDELKIYDLFNSVMHYRWQKL